jgi:hypothetical protein
MYVKGLTWLGLRTTQFEEMVTLFRDVMGMQPIRDEPEIAGFQLSDGTQAVTISLRKFSRFLCC